MRLLNMYDVYILIYIMIAESFYLLANCCLFLLQWFWINPVLPSPFLSHHLWTCS